ncbi:MAG: glycosyltransferase, partial [Muribaculaceae bacterium]|nr:glycosyltransferase [Muribaculaceae bacterium]
LAGLMSVMNRCDACVSIDADLQDDPRAIVSMVEEYRRGKEIVYGVRASRKTDTFFKRSTARGFYSFQKAMGLETVYDHADYRLMSNRALCLLSEYREANMFLRGIVPQIGLDTSVVPYDRNHRVAGESKYPLSKMLALSIDGITSFSAKPMQWIFMVGLISFVLTLAVTVYVLISYFYSSHINPGWASIMLSIWGLGSMILMSIGIVGEYIGKIFVEVKGRPRYAVKDSLWD